MIAIHNNFIHGLRQINVASEHIPTFVSVHKNLTQKGDPQENQLRDNLHIIRYFRFDPHQALTLQLFIMMLFISKNRDEQALGTKALLVKWKTFADHLRFCFKQRTKLDLKHTLMKSVLDGLKDDAIDNALDEYKDIYDAIDAISAFFYQIKDEDTTQDMLLSFMHYSSDSVINKEDELRILISLYIRAIEVTLHLINERVSHVITTSSDYTAPQATASLMKRLTSQLANLHCMLHDDCDDELNNICYPSNGQKFTFGLLLSDALINTRRSTHNNSLLKHMWWATVARDINASLTSFTDRINQWNAEHPNNDRTLIDNALKCFRETPLRRFLLSFEVIMDNVNHDNLAPQKHKDIVNHSIRQLAGI